MNVADEIEKLQKQIETAQSQLETQKSDVLKLKTDLGYHKDVYQYAGRRYMTRMPYDPGERIRIRVDVTPAAG